MRPDSLLAEFDIDRTPIWPDEDGRLEPVFHDAPLWIEFEEPAPYADPGDADEPEAPQLVEFDAFDAFDLAEPPSTAIEEEEPRQSSAPPAAPRPRTSRSSLGASLGVHLLTLLVLTSWSTAPADTPGTIPVRLVIAEASGAPPENEAGLAATESAEAAPAPATETDTVVPAVPPLPPPEKPRPQVAKAASPKPPPRPVQSPPAPTAAAIHTAAVTPAPPPHPPRSAAPPPQSVPVATAAPAVSSARSGDAAALTSGAGGGDYFAYLEQLTRPFLYMLSPAFLAGRSGRTTLSIGVLDDGTITRIGIKRSSGYPDIDARIEQMVGAVGRFPPLPAQLRQPGADLDFNLVFPDVLQH